MQVQTAPMPCCGFSAHISSQKFKGHDFSRELGRSNSLKVGGRDVP